MNDRTARSWARRAEGLYVATVVAALLVVLLDEVRSLSITYDEGPHLAAGLSYVSRGKIELNPEHPPLVKLLSGAAIRALGAREGGAVANNEWSHAEAVLFRENERFSMPLARPGAGSVVVAARLPLLVFPLLLALVAWAWARSRFGPWGGAMALTLVATWPDLLGHGAYVTTDVPFAAAALAAAVALDRLARRGGAAMLVAVGLSLGASLATKFSAVLLLPAFALGAIPTLLHPIDPAPVGFAHPFGAGSRGARAMWLALAVAVVLAVAAGVVFAVYLGHAPLEQYRRGFASVYANLRPGYKALCLGSYTPRCWYYFPAATLLKAPLGTLALLALAAYAAATDRRARLPFAAEAFLHAPALVLAGATCALAAPIGTRYVLPAIPFLLVSAARVAPWALGSRRRVALVLAAFAAIFVGAVRDHPFHASATNLLTGEARFFYRLLDDSNQDWGQGLVALADWQHVRGPLPLIVLPRGPFDSRALLDAYGVVGEPGLTLEPLFRPERGRVYAISAHVVSRARLVAEEEHIPLALGGTVEPSEIVGGGFLIFDLR